MKTTIKATEVFDFLNNLNGSIFGIDFVKRTTGEVRKMKATTNYDKHLKGGELNYSAKDKGLVIVFDLDKKGFRSIPADAVVEIRAKGNTYKVTA